ncbi:vp39 [Lambdina fiscellaria nucleopolyhedrovirus]|uniref:Vp39 n=1 Tax=Lambdina fiscellaria nucleopolyhedrovirus TaxID=1642929 RepID=A0A0E3Z6R9_9ABAC|nr:vp39 [Lambdina fiscellaria nucleopolyhedrovirus]AKC91688.1 vp39 [Lambdina fiscellaria nucleopolyhedrovirus]
MSLLAFEQNPNRVTNFCVFSAVRPFDNCAQYDPPCSNDATVNDQYYICQFHLAQFKMEKMVLPIPDANGRVFNRTLARSLVHHEDKDNDRILVPTRQNYETVIPIRALSLSQQLVWHMIYENEPQQQLICQMLRVSDRVEQGQMKLAQIIYQKTLNILSMLNPSRYCSAFANNNKRIWAITDDNTVALDVFNDMPPFIKNLLLRAVAPEKIIIQNESLLLRSNPTCHIRREGLTADDLLYNPTTTKYKNIENENYLRIQNVLKFEGNATAMQSNLVRFEPFPLVVPLFLGEEIMANQNTEPDFNINITYRDAENRERVVESSAAAPVEVVGV